MSDLRAQLGDYIEHVIERIDMDDLFEERIGSGPVRPIRMRRPSRALRPVLLYAAAMALVLLAGGAALLLRGGDTSPAPPATTPSQPPTTVVPEQSDGLDGPGDGSLAATHVIRLDGAIPESGWATDRIVAAEGAVWVGLDNDVAGGSTQPGALIRIDPAAVEVTGAIGLPGGVIDLVAESATLWALVSDDTLVRVDAASLESETIELGLGIGRGGSNMRADTILADGGLWVAGGDGVVGRVDVDSFAIETVGVSRRGEPLPVDMWIGEAAGTLWGLNSHRHVLVGIDLATYAPSQRSTPVLGAESWAILGGGAIWLAPPPDAGGSIVRFDLISAQFAVLDPVSVGWHAVAVDGGLWMAAGDGEVSRIEVSTGELTDVLSGWQAPDDSSFLGWAISLVATSDGSIWVSNTGQRILVRIDSQTATVTSTVEGVAGGALLAFDGAIWIAAEDGTITRVANAE